MEFRLIDEPEMEDFDAAIRDDGQVREDFDLMENVTGWEEGVTIVRSKKSGVERSYPIGNATVFLADFAQELARGIFR
jgi:hypothetical protein